MTKQRQPVGTWMRRTNLVIWPVLFLSNLERAMGGKPMERVISAVMMLGCLALFVYWWRTPTHPDASNEKR